MFTLSIYFGRHLINIPFPGCLDTAETSTPESMVEKDDLADLDQEAIDLVNWSRNL